MIRFCLTCSLLALAACTADTATEGDQVVTVTPDNADSLENITDLSQATDIVRTRGEGVVSDVVAEDYFLVLDHGPLPAIQMDAMRMPFDVHPSVDLGRLREGERILFDLAASEEEGLLILQICRPQTDGEDCLG